jgi:hypothetical protein
MGLGDEVIPRVEATCEWEEVYLIVAPSPSADTRVVSKTRLSERGSDVLAPALVGVKAMMRVLQFVSMV